jgi:hypothetical protein
VKRAILCLLVAGCGSGAGNNALSPDAACNRYLTCLQTAMPSGFGGALNAYGNSSACWHSTSQASQSCSQACSMAAQQAGCGCYADTDCAMGPFGGQNGKRCDLTTHTCVQCLSDADCASDPLSRHFCDTTKRACVGCLVNNDCPDKNCSTSAQGDRFCGSCSNITDGCTSECDTYFYCTAGQAEMNNQAWSVCLSDDTCCMQTRCGRFAALRTCLLQNCGTLMPDSHLTQPTAQFYICAETNCMDSEVACHANAC